MENYFRRPATRSMYVLWFEGLKLVAVRKGIMYLYIAVHGCAHLIKSSIYTKGWVRPD